MGPLSPAQTPETCFYFVRAPEDETGRTAELAQHSHPVLRTGSRELLSDPPAPSPEFSLKLTQRKQKTATSTPTTVVFSESAMLLAHVEIPWMLFFFF